MKNIEPDKAKEALDKADIKDLYAHYQKAVEQCDKTAEALGQLAEHYCGTGDKPHFLPSSDAVQSMERVALAAIELAKAVTAK